MTAWLYGLGNGVADWLPQRNRHDGYFFSGVVIPFRTNVPVSFIEIDF